MIAVIVPAHNEEACLGACLESLRHAALHPTLAGESVVRIVVLDSCTDESQAIAQASGCHWLTVGVRNVGTARATGAQWALDSGARWLAFTDADTTVAPDWLAAQLMQQSDAVCGTVSVEDWLDYGSHMQDHYKTTYLDRDGHRHIHGANLGVSAAAYQRAGGFAPLASSEDVAFVQALSTSGAVIAWSAAPRVSTSARKNFRAPLGFGATLARIDEEAHAYASGRSPLVVASPPNT